MNRMNFFGFQGACLSMYAIGRGDDPIWLWWGFYFISAITSLIGILALEKQENK